MQDASFAQRVSWAKSLARGRWKAILLAAGVSEDLLAKKNKPCPACGGTDRFSFLDKDGDGTYFCRGCGGGDGFSLLMKVRGENFLQALEFVELFCGIVPKTPELPEKSPQVPTDSPERERLRKITRLWAQARPIAPGDAVWTYLAGRGLDPRLAGFELRCHAGLEYLDDSGAVLGIFPTMLARVTDTVGQVVNLHRTYLFDGKKAPVPSPKKLMPGPIKGALVRFGRPVDILGLAEGVETALACAQLFSLPVWASLGVTNLTAVSELPSTVKRVRIYADNDANMAGCAGAFTLAHRLSLKGLDVKVIPAPDSGSDWLDFLNRRR